MIKLDSGRFEDEGPDLVKTTFPGGESCIRVPFSFTRDKNVEIQFDFENNGELFDLALLVDSLRRLHPYTEISLRMPYVPYARQDRVCNRGESLSIKVVADFINSLGFKRVIITDPHSDVTTALFNNVSVIEQSNWAGVMRHKVGKDTIIVSPDAGASKKAMKFAQAGGFGGFVKADKHRDLETGQIVATNVSGIPCIGTGDFLIVDDICDGGRTFIELAKELRKLTSGKIMLYVTHGIFSAGTEVLDGFIDELYTANPVGKTGRDAVASGKVIRV